MDKLKSVFHESKLNVFVLDYSSEITTGYFASDMLNFIKNVATSDNVRTAMDVCARAVSAVRSSTDTIKVEKMALESSSVFSQSFCAP